MKILAQNVKYLRTKMGLTQKDFSQKSGISQAIISKIEAGLSEGSIKTRERLAQFFNISFADLYIENLKGQENEKK